MSCLLCNGSVSLTLDLGQSPLANRFLEADQLDIDEPHFPLRLGRCDHCGHMQLMECVPPERMFDEYLYVSGFSSTLIDHLNSVAQMLQQKQELCAGSVVVDIGANDGTLLNGFSTDLVRVGIEPAENLHHLARSKNIGIVSEYFSEQTAETIVSRFGKASIVTSTNSFPHIQDLPEFFRGIQRLLDTDGLLMIEAHYLADIYDQLAFDTIYHEHVSYWHLTPLVQFLTQTELEVFDCQRVPIHHGQLRIFIQPKGARPIQPSVTAILQQEAQLGLPNIRTATHFADRVKSLKEDATAFLQKLLVDGRSILGYGAPAKGNTLLNYLEITKEQLPYIADRSTLKQGRFAPGTHIPIVEPETILREQPDYVLILAWNFVDEIVRQLSQYRQQGGKFLIPVPEFRIIEEASLEAVL